MFKTPAEEKQRAHEFLARMSVPSEPQIEPGRKRRSPFGVVGIGLMIYGAIIAAVGAFLMVRTQAEKAFAVNLAAGGLMFLTGFLLKILKGEERSPANS